MNRECRIPSLDLHVHLRGTIDHEIAFELAKRNGVHLAKSYFSQEGTYAWSTFGEFLTIYDQIGRVVRKAEDLHLLATSYLNRVASMGTIYVEFMLSPAHSAENGIPIAAQLEAMTSAFADAHKQNGIEGGLIITCVRHRGPEEAISVAEDVVANMGSSILGFGLTGNERLYDAVEFRGAFQIAEEAGLGLTAHTGEWGDAASVLHTVEKLNLSRVGHGIRAIEDRHVIEKLLDRDVGFEVCLSSNLALKACNSYKEHPLLRMIDAGCRVSLATDDPAFFCTTPTTEYEIARKFFGLSREQLQQISMNSVDMAFCDEKTKSKLRGKIITGNGAETTLSGRARN